jgi:hypothetical protein
MISVMISCSESPASTPKQPREVNRERFVLERLLPIMGQRYMVCEGVRDLWTKEPLEIAKVVAPIRHGEDRHILGIVAVLQVQRSGNPEDACEVRQLVVRPAVCCGV